MNHKQIKKSLIDKDLTITQIARELEPETGNTLASLVQMLSDMTYGRRWYPRVADLVAQRYGIRFVRPKAYEPRVRLKQAA